MLINYIGLLGCIGLAAIGATSYSSVALASSENEFQLNDQHPNFIVSIKSTVGSDGEILTDEKGMALYAYSGDTPNVSNCKGVCAKVWIPLLRPSMGINVIGSLNTSLIGSLRRDDGSTQVSFNGKPLYFYSEDKNPGDVKGKGNTDANGKWSLLKPDGTVLVTSGQEETPNTSTHPFEAALNIGGMSAHSGGHGGGHDGGHGGGEHEGHEGHDYDHHHEHDHDHGYGYGGYYYYPSHYGYSGYSCGYYTCYDNGSCCDGCGYCYSYL